MITTLDQKLVEYLNNWQIDGWPIGNFILVTIAIILSVLLCGAVGIEREWKGRSAGLRTHLLVGVGSCVLMIISIYGFPAIFGDHRDVARLAAQIITGVGFLGAGAILHHNSGIRGLTTAGTIWIVMAIGIACGSFNFIIAAVATIVILFVLIAFKKIESKINNRNPVIILTAPGDKPILTKILAVAKEFDATVHGLSTDILSDDGKDRVIECTFQVVFASGNGLIEEFISHLESETGAMSVQLLNSHRK